MGRIEESLEKEQERLNVLKEKRQKLDEQIKEKEKNIDKYTMMINQKTFSKATDVLKATGLSFEEIISAVKDGDLLKLQEKIENSKIGK